MGECKGKREREREKEGKKKATEGKRLGMKGEKAKNVCETCFVKN